MRIWQLCTPRELYSTETGGAVATVVAALARELVAQGHDVTVAARSDRTRRPETGAEFVSLGAIPWPSTPRAKIRWKTESVLNRVFGWPWPATTTYLRALRRQLRLATAPPEVVVVHNDPFVLRYLRRWAPKATVVLWMHNEPYRLPRRHRPADDADLVVTVSRFIATKVGPKLGLDPSRVVPIHNGVDSEAFHPRPGFDAPATPLRVLCLGRLDRRKGADTALEAVRRLRSEGLAVELDVVGSPWFAPTPGVDQGSWADDFVAELQAAGAHHLPHVDRDQVTAIVRAHDVVCVLSRWDDPFPLVVLEAMASGCAVVATERGGIPEAAGGAARIVAADDPAAAAQVLEEWASDPASLAAAKHAARRRALECTWARATDQFLGALAEHTPARSTSPSAPGRSPQAQDRPVR